MLPRRGAGTARGREPCSSLTWRNLRCSACWMSLSLIPAVKPGNLFLVWLTVLMDHALLGVHRARFEVVRKLDQGFSRYFVRVLGDHLFHLGQYVVFIRRRVAFVPQ